MTRATCRNCGDPLAKDERGWFHTRLPLKGGQPDTNPTQRDMFEVSDEP